MPDLNAQYEKVHIRRLTSYQQAIAQAYNDTIQRVFGSATGYALTDDTFRVTDYPSLNAIIEAELNRLQERVETIIYNGIADSFELSQAKFTAQTKATYGVLHPITEGKINTPQTQAIESFIKRKTGGLDVSGRVWKYTTQFRGELEHQLYSGIASGKSAKEMALGMQRYLRNPQKQMYSVAQADLAREKFKLSKKAKAFKPGQGVYKFSYDNALRLARTEVNAAYRTADIDRWQTTPFVLGYKTVLSNRHPKYDICDVMADQEFPVSFVWSGWHPQCLCHLESIMASKAEFARYEAAILAGKEITFKAEGKVAQMPEAFNTYVNKNIETFRSYKRLPAFLKDNPQVTKKF